MATSKNQRSGPRRKSKPIVGECGCELQPVLVVGTGMRYLCSHRGYKPLDMSLPYKTRKCRNKVGGKARIYFVVGSVEA